VCVAEGGPPRQSEESGGDKQSLPGKEKFLSEQGVGSAISMNRYNPDTWKQESVITPWTDLEEQQDLIVTRNRVRNRRLLKKKKNRGGDSGSDL